jgi:CRISPR type III-A-associated protein Csm2
MTTIENQIKIADDLAKDLAQKHKIKTHQIRNFFGQVSKIKTDSEKEFNVEKVKRQIFLLKPLLAYATGRQGKAKMLEFYTEIVKQIELVTSTKTDDDSKQAISNFFEFCTAIVAYHKFYDSNK